MPQNVKPVTHTGITAKDSQRISRLERRPSGTGQPFLSSSFTVQSTRLDPPTMGVPFTLDLSRDSLTGASQVGPPRSYNPNWEVVEEPRFSDSFFDNAVLHGASLTVYAELGAFSVDGAEALVIGLTSPVAVDLSAYDLASTIINATWNSGSPIVQSGTDLTFTTSPSPRIKTTAGGVFVFTGYIEFAVTV